MKRTRRATFCQACSYPSKQACCSANRRSFDSVMTILDQGDSDILSSVQ